MMITLVGTEQAKEKRFFLSAELDLGVTLFSTQMAFAWELWK